jgi:spore maturation protein SpmA
MKNRNTYHNTSQQRFSWALVVLFCLFVSSVEFFPVAPNQTRTEASSEQPDQSFLDVAVDAVVPFVLQVANTVFYLISKLFQVDFSLPLPQVGTIEFVNSLTEILFERIISPQGP